MAASMALRAPTSLKSIDLQRGQRVENSPNLAWIMTLRPLSPDRLQHVADDLRVSQPTVSFG